MIGWCFVIKSFKKVKIIMKKNIILILIQDLNELLEIKEKNLNAIFLPLDFSTLLYCKKNKLNHLNPIEF